MRNRTRSTEKTRQDSAESTSTQASIREFELFREFCIVEDNLVLLVPSNYPVPLPVCCNRPCSRVLSSSRILWYYLYHLTSTFTYVCHCVSTADQCRPCSVYSLPGSSFLDYLEPVVVCDSLLM